MSIESVMPFIPIYPHPHHSSFSEFSQISHMLFLLNKLQNNFVRVLKEPAEFSKCHWSKSKYQIKKVALPLCSNYVLTSWIHFFPVRFLELLVQTHFSIYLFLKKFSIAVQLGMWALTSPTGMKPAPPALRAQSLTTGPPGKSLIILFFIFCCSTPLQAFAKATNGLSSIFNFFYLFALFICLSTLYLELYDMQDLFSPGSLLPSFLLRHSFLCPPLNY